MHLIDGGANTLFLRRPLNMQGPQLMIGLPQFRLVFILIKPVLKLMEESSGEEKYR